VPGDFLDVILLVLCAAFAVAGYRQGFIIGVLSLAGFLCGVLAGAFIAPRISRAVASSPEWQAIIVILVLFGAAVLGMLVASGIGVAVRSRVTGRPATFLDSLGGAAVNVISVLLLAWLLGSLLVNASFPAVARQVNGSLVLRTVDRMMPHNVLYPQLLPPLTRLLSGTGLYSPIFSAIGAESSVNLPAASSSVLSSRSVARADRSIVKIVGVASSCQLRIEGSGFVISANHVLTNAHVVAGVSNPNVYAPDGQVYQSQVVFYDPQTDIAVLNVPGLGEPALKFAGAAPYGAEAVVAGYPLNHLLTLSPARVGEDIGANGPNIYETVTVHRQIYEIRAFVQPGNSGGPLLALDGRVYGVVFAASTTFHDTGYALTAAEVAHDVALGEQATVPVSTDSCQGS
jgi:S1-C subfamily serine protease